MAEHTMLETMGRAIAEEAGAKSCGFRYEQASVAFDNQARAVLKVLAKPNKAMKRHRGLSWEEMLWFIYRGDK